MTSRLLMAREMTIDDYRLLLLKREEARRALVAIAGLGDALISLSSVGPAPSTSNAGNDSGVSHTTGLPAYNAATSVLGAPAITVPLIAIDGMPVGVQVVGQVHTDAALSGTARWLLETMSPVVA